MGILKKFLKSEDDVVKEAAPKEVREEKIKKVALNASTAKTSKKIDAKKSSARAIIRRPVITEKSALLGSQNQYVFAVEKTANKIQIAKAVEAEYGVRPTIVRVMSMPTKARVRGKIHGRVAAWKKAVVTLPAGKSINVSEGV